MPPRRGRSAKKEQSTVDELNEEFTKLSSEADPIPEDPVTPATRLTIRLPRPALYPQSNAEPCTPKAGITTQDTGTPYDDLQYWENLASFSPLYSARQITPEMSPALAGPGDNVSPAKLGHKHRRVSLSSSDVLAVTPLFKARKKARAMSPSPFRSRTTVTVDDDSDSDPPSPGKLHLLPKLPKTKQRPSTQPKVQESLPKPRGRPKKPPVTPPPPPPDIPVSITLYVQYQWLEQVPGRKKGQSKMELKKGELLGPDTISDKDPATFNDVLPLLVTITGKPLAWHKTESFTWQCIKNGRSTGPFPLKNEAAFGQLISRILGMTPSERLLSFILIVMAPPKKPKKKKPDTDEESDDSEKAASDSDDPSKLDTLLGRKLSVDAAIAPAYAKLEKKYPVGLCARHPRLACVCHGPTQTHYHLDHGRKLTWALHIIRDNGTYTDVPVNKRGFRSEAPLDGDGKERINKHTQQPGSSSHAGPSTVAPPPFTYPLGSHQHMSGYYPPPSMSSPYGMPYMPYPMYPGMSTGFSPSMYGGPGSMPMHPSHLGMHRSTPQSSQHYPTMYHGMAGLQHSPDGSNNNHGSGGALFSRHHQGSHTGQDPLVNPSPPPSPSSGSAPPTHNLFGYPM